MKEVIEELEKLKEENEKLRELLLDARDYLMDSNETMVKQIRFGCLPYNPSYDGNIRLIKKINMFYGENDDN